MYINRCHCACPLGNLYNENESDIHSLHESFSLGTLYLIERKVRCLRTACLSPPFIWHFCLSRWHHQSITSVLRKSQQKGCWLNQRLTPFKVLMGWENTGSWMHNACISLPEHSVNFIRFGPHGSTGINIAVVVGIWMFQTGSCFFYLFQYHVYILRECGLVLSCLSLLQAAGRRVRQAVLPLGKFLVQERWFCDRALIIEPLLMWVMAKWITGTHKGFHEHWLNPALLFGFPL